MGADDEQMAMVAGFAGGLGLSGNACGALAASIWMKNIESCKQKKKYTLQDPNAEETLEKFYEVSDLKCSAAKLPERSSIQ